MRDLGLQGVIRGKPVRTTVSNKAAPCPLDHVNRQFHAPAPNMLWVSDFTYVATWAGFVYVAFVIDVYARYIVGWRVSRTAHAGFVLDALEQAIHERRPVHRAASSTTATAGLNMCLFAIPSAWRRRVLSPLSAAWATAMTVRRCMQSGRSDPCLRLTTCHGVDLSALQAAPEASRNVT
jgi:transposase InsO family protein